MENASDKPLLVEPGAVLPAGWGPILTIKVSQRGSLWAAWTDDVDGVLVHGHSLAEVLGKFPGGIAGQAIDKIIRAGLFAMSRTHTEIRGHLSATDL